MMSRAFVLILALTSIGGAGNQTVQPHPPRIAAMHDQFGEVSVIHNAITRGDLDEAREPARRLAEVAVPDGLPELAAKHVRAISLAARRAALASDTTSAAFATGEMLATCGTCHRAVGTFPALSSPGMSDVGGTVGHMLEHQRATEQLVRGLVIPSSTEWLAGARALRAAPLHASDLPRDAKLRPELLRVEEAVHRLAEEAVAAETAENRARVYATLLARCADCHRLHRGIWGPKGTSRKD